MLDEHRVEPVPTEMRFELWMLNLQQVKFVGFCNLEKGRRRQLLAIASHNDLFTSVDAVDGILRRNLRRFIENDQIERMSRRKEMADCQRTHHQARLQVGQKIRDPRKE